MRTMNGTMNDILSLLRLRQWYKNLVIFLAVVFSGNLFSPEAMVITITGFFVLCLLSSSSYIINDIADSKRDRHHPEKRFRPVASGRISVLCALALAVCLGSIAIIASFALGLEFFFACLALFVLSQVYTVWLKHEPLADMLLICVFFVLRAVSGAFLISVRVSPWLIVGTFFLSLFLVAGKRHSEASALGAGAQAHRATLYAYSGQLTEALMVLATSLLVVSYAMYTFLSTHPLLVVTIPLALYPIVRYLHLVLSGSAIAGEPSLAFEDIKLVIGGLLWGAAVVLVLYLV